MDAEREQKMELQRAMSLAIDDIQRLRKTNEMLGAKVEVIDLIAALVFPRRSQGVGEDSVWLLRRALESLCPPDPVDQNTE